jgi:hypothetical protein
VQAGLVLALAILAGCGGGDEAPAPPTGPLAEALAQLGGGGEGTIGVAWADPALVRESGNGPDLIAKALGPNAGSVIEARSELRRRFGLDPLAARDLISVGGSYAFGLRLDGVDGRRLASRLASDGGRERRDGELRLIDIGDYAVTPDAFVDIGVQGLGAFDALGPDIAVLAISGRARDSLLGRSEPLLDEAEYRAALDCLGDVVAARIIPDGLLLSVDLGVTLVAVGERRDGGEVLCTLGGSAERAAGIARALGTTLAPEARDWITRERIGDSIASSAVETGSYEGVEFVRADLTLQPDTKPGFVFGALIRASVVGWINGVQKPYFRGADG